MNDRLVVSRLAWEMAQFELHYLRSAYTALILNDQSGGHAARISRQKYQAALERAMRDEQFRRGPLGGDVGAGPCVGQDPDPPGQSA